MSVLTKPCYRDPQLDVVVDDGAARDAVQSLGDYLLPMGAELIALLVSWRLLLMPMMLRDVETELVKP
jgi:hypothetical protein